MELSGAQTQLADVLHVISQGLLAPVIIILIGLIGYALFCIGSIIAEGVNERRNYKAEMPKFLQSLMSAQDARIPSVIKQSGLLNRQKVALLKVYDYRTLPGDALVALIRRLVSEEETHYRHIVDRNNTAAKVSPMIGLMGTLIPLGPGVAALGQGNTAALSSSLLIAFDTTVAGLIVAAICLAIGKIRSNWYDDYMAALDSAMATLHEKIEAMRTAGEITIEEPSDYAFMFESALKKAKEQAKEGRAQEPKPRETATASQAAGSETQDSPRASDSDSTATTSSASSAASTPASAQQPSTASRLADYYKQTSQSDTNTAPAPAEEPPAGPKWLNPENKGGTNG